MADVAVVGSPSTNVELTVDLLQEATEERLVGALVHFGATQNGRPIETVGQIVSVELRNRWHEDSVFRNLIKRTGQIPPITSRQDTRTACLAVGATFRKEAGAWEPEVLGMVPPTGTSVSRISQDQLDRLLAAFKDEIFYLGHAYANDVLYPMWFKHFASGPGGAGEAYHTGIFGKTGSGKTGLAKYLLTAYARHPELGVLVIDPQGEFSIELAGKRVGEQGFAIDTAMERLGRPVQRYTLRDIQLERWDLLEDLLVSQRFCQRALGIPIASIDNAAVAAEIIVKALKGRFKLDSLDSAEALRVALNAAKNKADRIYATKERANRLVERIDESLGAEFLEISQATWQPLCRLFAAGEGRRRLFGIVRDLIQSANRQGAARPLVVVDISKEGGDKRIWSDELQRRILVLLLESLVNAAAEGLGDRSANTLVLLDEAHRHAPSGALEQGSHAQRLRSVLRQAVRETRKYGIGWFFISQTLGGLDNEIVQQLRSLFFGFGLALGDEFRKLQEFAGGDRNAMELYRAFRDPQSAPRPDLREFAFMAVGPVSPLSHSGKPMFFTAFNDPIEFAQVNRLVP
ncbi:ATP-binding protein [Micromonospora globbae]|uniref:ATP-binding protein n=1 Tax=Micromonospora globbae TaxID=1894969 RepID=UPI0037B1B882